MEKKYKAERSAKRKEIRSLDIPWWIGGPKVIDTSTRANRKRK